MDTYENVGYNCWVEEADDLLSARNDYSESINGVGDVDLKMIGAKSAEIRVGGDYAGSNGTGVGLVNSLIGKFEDKLEGNYEAVAEAMNEIFDCSEKD